MQYSTDLTVAEKKKIAKFSFSKFNSFQLTKHYGPKHYNFEFEIVFANFKWIITGTNKQLKISDWTIEYEAFQLNETGMGYESIDSWCDYESSLTGLESTIQQLNTVFA